MKIDNGHDAATAVLAKAGPGMAVAGASMTGIGLQEWVYILTITYLILQIVWFVVSKFLQKKKD